MYAKHLERLFEGDLEEVTILQVPRGAVRGIVTQTDNITPVAGARIIIFGGGGAIMRLQATTNGEGSFRFDGVPAGDLKLIARDTLTTFEGQADMTVTFEGEVVEQNVVLEAFGAVHVITLNTDDVQVDNVEVTLSGVGGKRESSGEITFENCFRTAFNHPGFLLKDQRCNKVFMHIVRKLFGTWYHLGKEPVELCLVLPCSCQHGLMPCIGFARIRIDGIFSHLVVGIMKCCSDVVGVAIL